MAKKKSDDQTSDGENETYEEEPNFEDSEGYVDEISDEGELYLRQLQHGDCLSTQTFN